MSISKFEPIETQRKNLQHYQALLAQYTKEYRRVGYQLYIKDTEQSSMQLLLQIICNLDDMNTALNDSYDGSHPSLRNEFMLLAMKNWLLLARIRKSLLVLNGCLIIKRSDAKDAPTFINLQKELGWCLDAVVFYKDAVFYVSQISKTLHSFKVSEIEQEQLKAFSSRFFEKSSSVAQPKDIQLLRSILGVHIGKGEKNVNYIDVVKKIEQSISIVKFKDDDALQQDLYHAFNEASVQSCQEVSELAFHLRLPGVVKGFIDKCRDNMAKLSYYYNCILQEKEEANLKEPINPLIKEYTRIFFDIHRKVIQEFDRLQQENKLEPIQKADYIKANFYAHYVRMNTHPSLQGNRIIDALKEPDKNELFIKKYVNQAIQERDVYFSKNSTMLLCHDMEDIITDMHAIADYFDITYKVCTELTNQLSFIMQLWFKIRDKSDTAYKETLYKEACTYVFINSHFYACYNLINNYLTGGDASLRIIPEFDDKFKEINTLFSMFMKEHDIYFMFDKIIEAELLEKAKINERDLLSSEPKSLKTVKPRLKAPLILDAKPVVEKKASNLIPNRENQDTQTIDLAIETGRQSIKRNNKDAFASFWKAYNLATNLGDVKRQLQAMDCLCYMAGIELNNQLKILEQLAKNPQQKSRFFEEANALLASLPKLRKTYDQYFKLANTPQGILTANEQEGVAYSRELFWKQFVTVQNKLHSLLEQQDQKKPVVSKKSQPVKSQKNSMACTTEDLELKSKESIHFELDKHFDDLANDSERQARPSASILHSQQIKITLPENIRRIFTFLETFKGSHYLVGSMVVQLLLKEFNLLPIAAHDADFISTCMDRASLIIAGFQENSYLRNLYSLFRRFEWPIDLIALYEEENWLMSSLSSRDFRIAAFSCDKEGNIVDYTGYGIEDLKERRLVMIGCPISRIKQDPVLVLRALKYMVYGFKPDELLLQALQSWQPGPDTNYSKLFAVARKHLLKPVEADAFLELLCEFNLLGKIFNLKDKAELRPMLGISPKGLSPVCQHGLFKNNQLKQENQPNNILNGDKIAFSLREKAIFKSF